ncbi:insulinoma-associated protein 2 [Rana temporaria]|uniref:insulinoma-associated protein 2 n=1 Tax=Rana temporaria TaxID=8407 RepID=UPI001AAD2806|nr:insulinoma-associated protein 2 [Rana temporaria]
MPRGFLVKRNRKACGSYRIPCEDSGSAQDFAIINVLAPYSPMVPTCSEGTDREKQPPAEDAPQQVPSDAPPLKAGGGLENAWISLPYSPVQPVGLEMKKTFFKRYLSSPATAESFPVSAAFSSMEKLISQHHNPFLTPQDTKLHAKEAPRSTKVPSKKHKASRKLHFTDEVTTSPVLGLKIKAEEPSVTARCPLGKRPPLGEFICQLCKEQYPDPFALAQHKCSRIVRVEYRCPECDKVFSCPANLASHRRWHKPRAMGGEVGKKVQMPLEGKENSNGRGAAISLIQHQQSVDSSRGQQHQSVDSSRGQNHQSMDSSRGQHHQSMDSSRVQHHQSMDSSRVQHHQSMDSSRVQHHQSMDSSRVQHHQSVDSSRGQNHQSVDSSRGQNHQSMDSSKVQHHQNVDSSRVQHHQSMDSSRVQHHQNMDSSRVQNHQSMDSSRGQNHQSMDSSRGHNHQNVDSSLTTTLLRTPSREDSHPPGSQPTPEESNEEEAFHCPYCHKRFRRHAYLRKHLITHQPYSPIDRGQLTYPCALCGVHFPSMDIRDKHRLWHAVREELLLPLEEALVAEGGQQIFPCELCPTAFFSSPGLTLHISKCHSAESRQDRSAPIPLGPGC